MPPDISRSFHGLRSSAPFWSLRLHHETREVLAMRQDTLEPPRLSIDRGAMLTAVTEGGYGYCATSDLSASGLQQALDRATRWAEATKGKSVVRYEPARMGAPRGGYEQVERAGFVGSGARLAQEALQLLAAPNCPSGKMDLLLLPDQMMLQVHESIGHPLELDRILGDERNYAGTSFVTPDMFGGYRYGSELLNVTYDPTRREELASFAYDDEGTPAQKVFLIRNGILVAPLGGRLSQARAGLPGTANSRACAWNRPPIDRMANINVEPGATSL